MRLVTIVVGPSTHITQVIGDDADFGAFLAGIRSNGYFYNGSDTYVPYAAIKLIFVQPAPDAPASSQGITFQ